MNDSAHRMKGFFSRAPILWTTLTILLAALITVSVYVYREIDNKLTSVALSRREAVANLMAITMSEKFGSNIEIAASLATRVQFTKLVAARKWQQAIAIMDQIPVDFPYVSRVVLVDRDGTLQADSPALSGVRGVNFASRDWYQGVSHGWRPYVSELYVRKAAPQLKVYFVAVPVKTANGQVAGILGLQISIEHLLQWLEGIKLDLGATIYLMDPNGQMILRSKQGDRKEIITMPAPKLVQVLQHSEHKVVIGLDEVTNQQSIINYAPVPGYQWGVVVVQPVSSSIVLKARDEQLRILLVGFCTIFTLGIMAMTMLLRGVSARQKAQQQLLIKAELERSVAERTIELTAVNREVEAFSYSVSHDLRAPLRSIDGFSQALLEDYADKLDEQGKDYLNRVRAATQRMGILIDDMLTLSRVTRNEMKRTSVDLSALAANVLVDVLNAEPDRKVDWRIAPKLTANGDEQLLRVVLVNLLGNAWKFTGKTAAATIEFGAAQDADGVLEYYVRDNGAGFDMTYVDKLFGAFQRLHLASEFPGTGIGLATVQRIVHRHGGQVRATGIPGQGATFYFTLPG